MKLTAIYDPAKDAENHIRAIVDAAYLTHGRVGMKEQLIAAVELKAVRTVLTKGGERNDLLDKMTTLFTKDRGRPLLEEKARQLEAAWVRLGDQVIFQLEALYGRDWPFEAVHIDLTTLPICPYDYKARQIFVHAMPGTQTQLCIISHELNHFMFYWVYSKKLKEKLGRERFELLKESVTIFTNPEQTGKPNEEPLRKLYVKKRVRTLDEAVKVGVDYLIDKN